VSGAAYTCAMAHVGRRLNPAEVQLGRLVRDVRIALGWSQRDLGRRVGRSQAWLSRAERGLVPDISAARVERILSAMGARLLIDVDAPFLADRRRQREPAHARTSGHVAMRLRAAGWLAETEVEIGDGRRRGWIDVLAWHPHTGLLLVIEVKTEIHDLGAIQRTLGWYEREAWAAARRLGWRPRMTHGSLLLLATEANDRRAIANAEGLAAAFPLSAAELAPAVVTGAIGPDRGRSVAMVDPRSRRTVWIRPLRLHGRRSPAPYEDYAAFLRGSRARPGARRARDAR